MYELFESGRTISLAWITSHVGIPGNESVDALARSACSSGVHLDLPQPYSDLFESTNAISKQHFLSFLINPKYINFVFFGKSVVEKG